MASTAVTYFEPKSEGEGLPVPRAALFDAEARQVAKELVGFEPTQLRRFYGVVSALRNEVRGDQRFPDDLIRARLALLKAHVHYAYGRDSKKFPRTFVDFIDRHASSVRNRSDFLFGFAPHFEAVVAYHRYERDIAQQKKQA